MSTGNQNTNIKYHYGISPSPPFLLTDPNVTYADTLKGK
jgi:hypothetical protein